MSILELATGTARAAIPIAQAGHTVVGIERDPAMLAIAKRKRDAVGLTDRQLNLIRGDVLTAKLGRKFDRVCIFFNTLLAFTTLQQQDKRLQNVSLALCDPIGLILARHLSSRPRHARRAPQQKARNVVVLRA